MKDLTRANNNGDGDCRVSFDYTNTDPHHFRSWRFRYEDVTLDHYIVGEERVCTVSDLLKRAESAQYETMEGWKGGEYTMSPETPLWADDAGESYGMAITGLKKEGDRYIITTIKIEDLFALDPWR